MLAVTDASAAGDPVSALARLDELQAALLDANAKGTVEQSRFDSISAAIALVRADLEKAIAAQVEVVPEVSQETPMTDKEAKKAAEEAKKAAEEAQKEAEKQEKDNKDD
ncbi:hypothetical protein QMG83_05720 [Salinibacterium sp. G-O1]|uniref:hypothetical protein n=1 Tax=Salinibacterium sp. G-O1 TaxID=3046208 RepID=UPI0024BB6317|nr:hypothetical protein [Salinibacterium sp. G-O1]MDJ0334717.1 hypothetical protein [Salinibacterium sp. G-O1]